MSVVDIVHRLRRIADSLERDRREPDKVLCYVADLRRMATDQDNALAVAGDALDADAETYEPL